MLQILFKHVFFCLYLNMYLFASRFKWLLNKLGDNILSIQRINYNIRVLSLFLIFFFWYFHQIISIKKINRSINRKRTITNYRDLLNFVEKNIYFLVVHNLFWSCSVFWSVVLYLRKKPCVLDFFQVPNDCNKEIRCENFYCHSNSLHLFLMIFIVNKS
jgi:hypothetical protein